MVLPGKRACTHTLPPTQRVGARPGTHTPPPHDRTLHDRTLQDDSFGTTTTYLRNRQTGKARMSKRGCLRPRKGLAFSLKAACCCLSGSVCCDRIKHALKHASPLASGLIAPAGTGTPAGSGRLVKTPSRTMSATRRRQRNHGRKSLPVMRDG